MSKQSNLEKLELCEHAKKEHLNMYRCRSDEPCEHKTSYGFIKYCGREIYRGNEER